MLADSDDGTPAHDVFGALFNLPDLGLGINEACSAQGDSGGPAFIDGKIAATVDFGDDKPGRHQCAENRLNLRRD